jgi:hypothetical protein
MDSFFTSLGALRRDRPLVVSSDDPVVALAVLVDVLTLVMVLLSTKVLLVLLTLVLVERTSLTATVDILEVDVVSFALPTVDDVLVVAGVTVGGSFTSHAASSIVPSAVAKP